MCNTELNIDSAGTNATNAADFVDGPYTIDFEADESMGCVNITIIDDGDVESFIETLSLTIDTMGYGNVDPGTNTVVYIQDNDSE